MKTRPNSATAVMLNREGERKKTKRRRGVLKREEARPERCLWREAESKELDSEHSDELASKHKQADVIGAV